MCDVTRDDLERLRGVFEEIEDELRHGSIVTAAEMASAGQHNVDQLLDETQEPTDEDTEE